MRNENGVITLTEPNEVFVFGSNAHGNHAWGAARYAVLNYGAINGQAHGLQGRSYAIDTMSGAAEMECRIGKFLAVARENPDLVFIVTPIGCGIAGYRPCEVAPMFVDVPENVVLPHEFK